MLSHKIFLFPISQTHADVAIFILLNYWENFKSLFIFNVRILNMLYVKDLNQRRNHKIKSLPFSSTSSTLASTSQQTVHGSGVWPYSHLGEEEACGNVCGLKPVDTISAFCPILLVAAIEVSVVTTVIPPASMRFLGTVHFFTVIVLVICCESHFVVNFHAVTCK